MVSTSSNHFAFYDLLCIGSRLDRSIYNTGRPEFHLFSYLACLLSLYRGYPAADWQYDFAVTNQGYPFSAAIDNELDTLLRTGRFRHIETSIKITPLGLQTHQLLARLSTYKHRTEFLEGATSTILALPLGTIYSSIAEGTEIKNALALAQNRQLFAVAAQQKLYEQFRELSTVLGVNIDDLMVPAVVWLTYFAEAR